MVLFKRMSKTGSGSIEPSPSGAHGHQLILPVAMLERPPTVPFPKLSSLTLPAGMSLHALLLTGQLITQTCGTTSSLPTPMPTLMLLESPHSTLPLKRPTCGTLHPLLKAAMTTKIALQKVQEDSPVSSQASSTEITKNDLVVIKLKTFELIYAYYSFYSFYMTA